jgi:hypothetical protein
VAIFDRLLRSRSSARAAAAPAATALEQVPAHLLPQVNQRVTVTYGDRTPMPSRVEDLNDQRIVLADPSLPVEFGDRLLLTWEHDDTWCSLETRVTGLDDHAAIPTVHVAAAGRFSRFDERRRDVRRAIELPLFLRITRSRAVRPGHELETTTTEVSGTALRFATSAPFAPGDLIEAKITVDGSSDPVTTRLRVIRIDSVSGSWRSTCTAAFDEILRSDRSRLLSVVATNGRELASTEGEEMPVELLGNAALEQLAPSPPTADGVGGRDEPVPLSDLNAAVDWLKRRS